MYVFNRVVGREIFLFMHFPRGGYAAPDFRAKSTCTLWVGGVYISKFRLYLILERFYLFLTNIIYRFTHRILINLILLFTYRIIEASSPSFVPEYETSKFIVFKAINQKKTILDI
jgi:hypothetical protein